RASFAAARVVFPIRRFRSLAAPVVRARGAGGPTCLLEETVGRASQSGIADRSSSTACPERQRKPLDVGFTGGAWLTTKISQPPERGDAVYDAAGRVQSSALPSHGTD